ncbi:hypothetical protein D3C84_540860 [compost metagenome]
MVDATEEVSDKGFESGDVPWLHLPVKAIAHVQAPGLVEQRLGIVQLAHAQAAILKGHARLLAVLGDLPERRAGAALRGVAQVEVGVEVEDADTRARLALAQVFGQAQKAGIGDLVPAAQPQRQMALLEQLADALGISLLRTFQVSADTGDVAAVVQSALATPGQVGQGFAQGLWPLAGAATALVAADAFVARQAHQGAAGCLRAAVRLHPLVPAQCRRAFVSVNTALPHGHGEMCGHAGYSRLIQSSRAPTRRATSRVQRVRRSLFCWARMAGAIRLIAPCKRLRLSSTGALTPQIPSSISPRLTA